MISNLYIPETTSQVKLSVQSKSKKIQKAKSNNKKPSAATYNTFDNNEKKAIIMDLKKSLSKIRSLKENCSSEEFLEVLTKVHKNDFNTFLRSSLSQHFPAYDNSTEGLRIWRRRVKDWLKVLDKPESRGTLLVPNDKLEDFKILLLNALNSFPYRSLKLLRQSLYQIFNQIGKPLGDKNTCSKHWWYDFLKNNSNVRNAWESLPKRPGCGQENSSQDNEDDEWTTTETIMMSSPQLTSMDSMVNNNTGSEYSPVIYTESEPEENNNCMLNFPIVEFDESFGINFVEKQKSIHRAPSLGWEKFFKQESISLDFKSFNKQVNDFNTFINPNAFEF